MACSMDLDKIQTMGSDTSVSDFLEWEDNNSYVSVNSSVMEEVKDSVFDAMRSG